MHYLLSELSHVIEQCDKNGNDKLLLPFARMVSVQYDYYIAKAIDNPKYFVDVVKFFNDYTIKREANPPAVISFKQLKKHALKYKENLFADMPDDLARKLSLYFLTHFDKYNARRVFEVSKGPVLIVGEDYHNLVELYKREKPDRVTALEELLSEKHITDEHKICEHKRNGD